MSEKEVFVSRRGRKTTLDDDLTAIDVENETSPQGASEDIPLKHRPRFFKPNFSHKRTKVFVVVVAAVLLVPLLAAELLAWQYRSNAEKIQTETIRIGQDVALKKQKEKKYREALDESANALSSLQQTSCKGGLFDNAASLYPRAKTAFASCNAANQELSALVTSLTTLQQSDDYTVRAQTIIKTPLAPSAEAYAVILDQIAAWNTALTKTKELRAPTALMAFHAAFIQAVEVMASGWSELNVANNAQDQAGFDAAEKKLTEGYASLRDLTTGLNAQLNQQQTQITLSFKKITTTP